jgi:hypothetical protein
MQNKEKNSDIPRELGVIANFDYIRLKCHNEGTYFMLSLWLEWYNRHNWFSLVLFHHSHNTCIQPKY